MYAHGLNCFHFREKKFNNARRNVTLALFVVGHGLTLVTYTDVLALAVKYVQRVCIARNKVRSALRRYVMSVVRST